MLRVETFQTLAEAERAMTGGSSRFLGGGTLVMRQANYGDPGFERIVRSLDRAASEIRAEGGRIRLGSAVTMAAVLASRDLSFLHPVARQIGGPAIRNMATIGGNLFAPHPFGDFAVALLALDARVHWVDGREEPLETFFQGRAHARGLVAAVSVPRPGSDALRYLKVSRVKPKGVSVMSLAAWLPRQGGRLGQCRLAFGAMGPTPLRAKLAEAALNGAALDEAGIAGALRVALDGLAPSDDSLASAWYRREVAPVHLKRLLLAEARA